MGTKHDGTSEMKSSHPHHAGRPRTSWLTACGIAAVLGAAALAPGMGGCDPSQGLNLDDDGWWVRCREWDEGQQAYMPYGADYGDLFVWACVSQHLEGGSSKENLQKACAQVADEAYPGFAPHDPDLFVGEIDVYDVGADCTLDEYTNDGWPSVWELYPQEGEYVGEGQQIKCRYYVTYETQQGGFLSTFAYDHGLYMGCMDPDEYAPDEYCELSDCNEGLLPEKLHYSFFGWEWEDGIPEDIEWVTGCVAVTGYELGALNSCGPPHVPYPAWPTGLQGGLDLLFEDPMNSIGVDMQGKIVFEDTDCSVTGGCDEQVFVHFAAEELDFVATNAAGMTHAVALEGVELRQIRPELVVPTPRSGNVVPRLELRLVVRSVMIDGGPVAFDPINVVLENVQVVDDPTTCERRLIGSLERFGGTFNVELSAHDPSACTGG